MAGAVNKLKPPAGLGGTRTQIRIPRLRRRTQMPHPPRIFRNATKTEDLTGLQHFLDTEWHASATTSRSEGYIFWAFQRVKGEMGKSGWGYQVGAGRGMPGGAIIDFVVWDPQPRIAIRIQTERFHIATTSRKQIYDEVQRRTLVRSGWIVIDIYEEHFLKDKSGQAAIALVRAALQFKERPSPITSGSSLARPGANL